MKSFDLLMQDTVEDEEVEWCCYLHAQETEPCMCMNDPDVTDTVGYKWCLAHSYRGDMLNMAKEKGWPEVRFLLNEKETVQSDGAYYWVISAFYQPEEYIAEAFAALASVEMEKSA
jgi:hypothetical protein